MVTTLIPHVPLSKHSSQPFNQPPYIHPYYMKNTGFLLNLGISFFFLPSFSLSHPISLGYGPLAGIFAPPIVQSLIHRPSRLGLSLGTVFLGKVELGGSWAREPVCQMLFVNIIYTAVIHDCYLYIYDKVTIPLK